jgi:hypothetical protein
MFAFHTKRSRALIVAKNICLHYQICGAWFTVALEIGLHGWKLHHIVVYIYIQISINANKETALHFWMVTCNISYPGIILECIFGNNNSHSNLIIDVIPYMIS